MFSCQNLVGIMNVKQSDITFWCLLAKTNLLLSTDVFILKLSMNMIKTYLRVYCSRSAECAFKRDVLHRFTQKNLGGHVTSEGLAYFSQPIKLDWYLKYYPDVIIRV